MKSRKRKSIQEFIRVFIAESQKNKPTFNAERGFRETMYMMMIISRHIHYSNKWQEWAGEGWADFSFKLLLPPAYYPSCASMHELWVNALFGSSLSPPPHPTIPFDSLSQPLTPFFLSFYISITLPSYDLCLASFFNSQQNTDLNPSYLERERETFKDQKATIFVQN